MLYLDVDLHKSAKDALGIFKLLDARGAIFSHEFPKELFEGNDLNLVRDHDQVLPAIFDAYKEYNLSMNAVHVSGNTGAFREENEGIPVLPLKAAVKLRNIAYKTLGF